MSNTPEELKYAASHEWARLDGDIVTVGISDHAQDALGDLVYVELPSVGDSVQAGDEAGVPILTGHHRRHHPIVHRPQPQARAVVVRERLRAASR